MRWSLGFILGIALTELHVPLEFLAVAILLHAGAAGEIVRRRDKRLRRNLKQELGIYDDE